jgi:hypothetical protein
MLRPRSRQKLFGFLLKLLLLKPPLLPIFLHFLLYISPPSPVVLLLYTTLYPLHYRFPLKFSLYRPISLVVLFKKRSSVLLKFRIILLIILCCFVHVVVKKRVTFEIACEKEKKKRRTTAKEQESMAVLSQASSSPLSLFFLGNHHCRKK